MPTSMIVQHSALSQERKLVPGPLTCNLRPPAVRPQATKLLEAPTRDCSPSLLLQALLPEPRLPGPYQPKRWSINLAIYAPALPPHSQPPHSR